jgi:hypothetical protein
LSPHLFHFAACLLRLSILHYPCSINGILCFLGPKGDKIKIRMKTFVLLCVFLFSLVLFTCGNRPDMPAGGIAALSPLRINEVAISNKRSLVDDLNETPDWIELHNPGIAPIDLKGYGLGVEPGNGKKWIFGSRILMPGCFFIVYASGRNFQGSLKEERRSMGISEFVEGWADNQNDPPGNSSIVPVDFGDAITGVKDGRRILSARVTLSDNSHLLIWQKAQINVLFSRSGARTFNLEGYDKLCIVGTMEKGGRIGVRVLQRGLNDWVSYNRTITGNGRTDFEYMIPLRNEPPLDLSVVTGIQFVGVDVNTTVALSVRDIVFVKSAGYPHADFRLSGKKTAVSLYDPSGRRIERIGLYTTPMDVSQGRSASGDRAWVICGTATPGRPNSQQGYYGMTRPVTISPQGGFFNGPVTVKMEEGDGRKIYYTTDGSPPSMKSPRYDGSLTLRSTTVIRAGSFEDGLLSAAAQTETYFIDEEVKLPVVSVVVDPVAMFDPETGMYSNGPKAGEANPYFGANFWEDREIPASLELYETDGSRGFKIDAGLEISGNWSRANPKKALGINLKKEYGPEVLEYCLFPQYPTLDKFRSFLLRNNGTNYQKAMFEDPLLCTLGGELGLDFSKYRPVIVFINGKYWGLHDLREKHNPEMIRTNYGYKGDEIDMIKDYGYILAGDMGNYLDMLAFIRNHPVSEKANYERLKAMMEIQNFMNYVTLQVYFANTDWPANNNIWWRPRHKEGRWRWLLYDTDAGLNSWGQSIQYDFLSMITSEEGPTWPNPPWSTFLLRSLLSNAEFRRQFINRIASLAATVFSPERVDERIDAMAAEIRPEISRDMARWGRSEQLWQYEVDGIKAFARKRPESVFQNYLAFFKLGGTAVLNLDAKGGAIDIDGIRIGQFPYSARYFTGNPVQLTALVGKKPFRKWSDGITAKTRMVNLAKDTTLTAVFE